MKHHILSSVFIISSFTIIFSVLLFQREISDYEFVSISTTLHHLGDGDFSRGSNCAQNLNTSEEGVEYTVSFKLHSQTVNSANLSFEYICGLEEDRRSIATINGFDAAKLYNGNNISFSIPVQVLMPNKKYNLLKITSSFDGKDYDDFEFKGISMSINDDLPIDSFPNNIIPISDACEDYPQFIRPNTSLFRFPEDRKIGHVQRTQKRMLQALEDVFVMHLVHCEENWNLKLAMEWNTRRELLAKDIIEIQYQFIFSFSGLHYNEEENKILEQAYQNERELKQAIKDEEILWNELSILLKKFEDIKHLYQIPESSTKLAVLDAQYKLQKTQKKWQKKSTEINEMKRHFISGKKEAKSMRFQRGLKTLKSLYGLKFDIIEKQDLTSTSSHVKKLLGKSGMQIFLGENKKRGTKRRNI